MIEICNSFFKYLQSEVPHVILIFYICHLSALIASKAYKVLSRSLEELRRSTYNCVSGSAKKCATLIEMQEFFHIEQKKSLKVFFTRWLDRQDSVVRLLENWDVLKHSFQFEVVEDRLKSSESICIEFNNIYNKGYLYFLNYVLDYFNSFNVILQFRKTLIQELYTKSQDLMKQLCQNFIIPTS
ncbi:hypothetical protein BDFB_012351 [Asbolus verrucosus]|uniref:Uncharacterized protein n=1 Tax=Asbolus verrucosus TaxID=1661398 RepID=A0A482VI41_ASBVE|nr:hypothetical protein BDFB_012351 [Asbolus verrucosus]